MQKSRTSIRHFKMYKLLTQGMSSSTQQLMLGIYKVFPVETQTGCLWCSDRKVFFQHVRQPGISLGQHGEQLLELQRVDRKRKHNEWLLSRAVHNGGLTGDWTRLNVYNKLMYFIIIE